MKTAISNYSLSSKTQVNFFMRKRIMSLRAVIIFKIVRTPKVYQQEYKILESCKNYRNR